MTVVVAGAPCSGKTTWVEARMQMDGMVVDFDAIVKELTGQRYTEDGATLAYARRLWWERARSAPAFVTVATMPRGWQRRAFAEELGARLVLVDTPAELCLARAKAERPPRWAGYVLAWFAAFTATSADERVSGFSPRSSRRPIGALREKDPAP